MAELPKSAVGKVLRRKLRDLDVAAAPPPAPRLARTLAEGLQRVRLAEERPRVLP